MVLRPAAPGVPPPVKGGAKDTRSGSTYDQVHIRIDLERSAPTVFWKLTIPLCLAVLIAVSAFLVSSHREEPETTARLEGVHSRLGVLGGGLFVVVLNMQQADDVITSSTGLTLIDRLHLTTLAFLLLAVAGTVLAWSRTSRGPGERSTKFSYIAYYHHHV
ncbi:hypothetical protein [Streptomyces roseoverticillatus]|uniref:Uncharacterized protein n=1 Tax=Streptomyces roseoverticillatus TaxID=66429 RepID=A0ABV3IUE4_9ACTN